jgi:hypothetical protein
MLPVPCPNINAPELSVCILSTLEAYTQIRAEDEESMKKTPPPPPTVPEAVDLVI